MIYGISMDLKAYEITSQGTLIGIPVESLSPEWYQDETQRWLDVEGGNPEALRELLAPFDLHPLVMDACIEPGVAGHFTSYEKEMQRFEASLSDLHQQYVLTQQDKMNSRLQILTVISAVFLPLTLLAGIYGMNFVNMPELQWTYGYLVVIGLMAVIVVVMLYVFYRRGWFK